MRRSIVNKNKKEFVTVHNHTKNGWVKEKKVEKATTVLNQTTYVLFDYQENWENWEKKKKISIASTISFSTTPKNQT